MKLRPLSPATPLVERPAWQGFGFAALMLIVALGTRWLLDPYVHGAVPLSTVFVGAVVTVWFAGWQAAAVVAIAGYVLALWAFIPPRHVFKLWESFGAVRAVLYFLSCTVTILLCELLRRSQRRRAASEARLLSILENMHEGFCAVDAQWRLTLVNRSAERALARSRDQLLDQPLWAALPALAGRPAEAELRRALREQVSVQFETNAVTAGAWHSVSAIPAPDGLSIFLQDVTTQKAHVDQLERLVDDRTAALQRLVTELESFSYTLVHDMRAPLRSITSFAELLSEDHAAQLDAQGRHYLGRIHKSARRMDQLIVDILDYSQLSRSKPELRSMDLNETIRDILRSHPDFRPEAADIAIEGTLPKVRGNDALLTQCFSNLLHNATKFVAPGVKPRIRLSAQLTGAHARIEIADNGIGIAPEATARIFEPFRRENPDYEGTGIGLAIVRKVVDQLDGRVGVESDGHSGSRFWVELQLAPPAAVTSGSRAVPHAVA